MVDIAGILTTSTFFLPNEKIPTDLIPRSNINLSDLDKTLAHLGLAAPPDTLNTDATNKRTYKTGIEKLTFLRLTESVFEQTLL